MHDVYEIFSARLCILPVFERGDMMELFKLLGTIAISGAAEAQNDIARTAEQAGSSSVNIRNAFQAIGTAVTTYLALDKIKEFGAYIVNVGSSFELAMSEVEAISGATGDELDALTAKAKEMGITTKFSASDSAEAFKYMAMAGWKTEDMLAGIEGIMNLAAASGENLGEVSDIVTDALTAFGLSASDSAHFSDVLAAASNNANTNVSMLGSSFKYVAPVAGALGYSIEDVSVALGLMANSGIKAEQAGTSMRAMLSRLASPTKDVYDAFELLGMDASEALTNVDGSMKPLSETIDILREKMSGLTEAEKASVASGIAGQEAMSGLLAIVNASDEDYQKLSTAIADADGTAQNMADTMNDNLSGAITLLKSAFEGLGISIFEKFAPIAQKAIEKLTGFVQWLTEHEDAVALIAIAIGTVTAALIAYNVAQTMANAGMTIGSVAGAAFGAVMKFIKSPITLVVLAIGALIAIIVLCVKHWDEIKEAAGKAWDWIKGVWESASTWFNEKVVQPVVNWFTGLWDSVKNAAKSAWEFIKGIWVSVSNWFNQKIVQPISTLFTNLWKGIKEAFKTPINWIIDGINSFIRGINKIKIPDWVPLVGGLGFRLSELPRLKQGGVLEKGQVGLLEGDGAEAVVPLHQNRKWISAVAAEMNVTVGGSDLSRKLDKLINMLDSYCGKMIVLSERTIVSPDGKELARFIAPYMGAQLQLVRG